MVIEKGSSYGRLRTSPSIKQEELYSDTFGGYYKWQVIMYPKGYKVADQLSIYLNIADLATSPRQCNIYTRFRFTVINQIDRQKDTYHEFSTVDPISGLDSFLPLSELQDPTKGYLVNDACLVEVDVDACMVEFDVAIDSVQPGITIGTSPATKRQRTVATEAEEPMEKEIDALFTNLESELTKHKIYSPEEAKEALSKIEQALNVAPGYLYETGKFSPLHEAFNVLARCDCFSALTIEQKAELFAMEKSFKELPERVVKAMQDKNMLSEKESWKLMLARDLENGLKLFKGKEELKQIEQNIGAHLEKVVEEQKKKMNISASQKEKLKIAKEMKMELETLGKEWSEYDAKAKAAEGEENTVAAERRRMKDFISSVKEITFKGTN